MMNIGIRAHDMGKFSSAEELADVISSIKKPATIQLALGKAVPSAKKWAEWDEEYISSIRDTLKKKGVSISVVGCYINPVNPDPDTRDQHLRRFERSLSLTKAFGCRIVGTETGSWTPDTSFNPETFEDHVWDVFMSSLERMVNAAIKHDAIVGIEPVSYKHTICTIERTVKILDAFKDEHLRIIWDPVNLIPQSGIPEKDGAFRAKPTIAAQRTWCNACLDAFGDRISIIHCKDYTMNPDGSKKWDNPVLTGCFDWRGLFGELRARGIDVPILLENQKIETVKEAIKTLEGY